METLKMLKELELNARTDKNGSYEQWKFYKELLEKYVLESHLVKND